jgi:hypothetical protein
LDWTSFMIGSITALFAFGLFTSKVDEVMETDDSLQVNDFSSRRVVMSCQSCRKLKPHVEIEPDLYQCPKCKRHVDLRKTS